MRHETTLADVKLPSLDYLPARGRYELFACVGYPISEDAATGWGKLGATYSLLDRDNRREVYRWRSMLIARARQYRPTLVRLVRLLNEEERELDRGLDGSERILLALRVEEQWSRARRVGELG